LYVLGFKFFDYNNFNLVILEIGTHFRLRDKVNSTLVPIAETLYGQDFYKLA